MYLLKGPCSDNHSRHLVILEFVSYYILHTMQWYVKLKYTIEWSSICTFVLVHKSHHMQAN